MVIEMNKGEVIPFLLVIAALGLALLIADRYLRIAIYIEPFEGSMDAACGVDMAPCNYPLQCVNGYCKSVRQPRLPANNIPVLP